MHCAATVLSMSIQKIAVLGAGNGGCAAAADLTLRGFEVRLFSRSESTMVKVRQARRESNWSRTASVKIRRAVIS